MYFTTRRTDGGKATLKWIKKVNSHSGSTRTSAQEQITVLEVLADSRAASSRGASIEALATYRI